MQKYAINSVIPRCSILGRAVFLLYIDDFPNDVNYNIAISAGDSIHSIAKTILVRIVALIGSMKFISSEVALHLCKSAIQTGEEYCYHT